MSNHEPDFTHHARMMPVPDSATPTMHDLMQCVRSRRRRRHAVRISLAGCVLTSCLVLLVTQRRQDANHNRAIQAPVADSRPSEPAVSAMPLAANTDDRPTTMQLFARVRGDSPVFEFDTETKRLQHVGWVSSEQMVPIDMRYVPSQQQETFNAVLHRTGEPLSL